jgi:outer membrane receptor for ferrienterochelin and colicin
MREVLAFSIFYKDFKNPIEEVLRSRNTFYISYDNAKGADVIGVELEARKGLEFIAPALKELSALGNVTFVHSSVQLASIGSNTNPERPLSNQSPYIVNLALDYSHAATKTQARVLYNVNGPRIVTVGAVGLEDIYERPRHLVDLTVVQGLGKHFELKGSVQNLLNSPIRTTQSGADPDGDGPTKAKRFVTGEARTGATIGLAAAYTH